MTLQKKVYSTEKKRFQHFWILSAVLLGAFLSYSPNLSHDFTNWDDKLHVIDNPLIRSLKPADIGRLFKTTVSDIYVPLTMLTFAVEYHFFKLNPLIYHLNNVLLHLGVVVLIYWLALRIGLSTQAAAFSALLFAIHPIHVEPVAWISERKDVLYAFLYMFALLSYWSYLKEGKVKFYWMTFLLGALSICAKPMAVSLPVVLLVYDWLARRPWSLRIFLEKLPFFVYVLPIAWLTHQLNPGVIAARPSISESILLYVWTFIHYLRKFFWPFHLVPVYDLPQPIGLFQWEYGLSLLGFLLLFVLLIRFRRNRLLVFAVLHYFASIFFVLRLGIPNDTQMVVDRYMYLPSLGFCFLIGVILDKGCGFTKDKRGTSILVIALFAVLSVLTYKQSQIWRNSETLLTYIIDHVKGSAIAHNHRGSYYSQQKQFNLALVDFNRALEFSPDYAYAYNNRGLIFKNQGDLTSALEDFNKAIELDDQYYEAYYHRANLFRLLKDYNLALKDLNKSLALKPVFSEGYLQRGQVYALMKKYDLAIADFDQAVHLDPNLTMAYRHQADAAIQMNNFPSALTDYNRYLQVNKTDGEAFYNRGNIYAHLRNYPAAIEDYSQTIQLDPAHPNAYHNRSLAFFTLDEYVKALADALKVEELGGNINSRYIRNLKTLIAK
ncbi:MAG: tetratricopeptide repeat protein [Candidatus Omnitrophica bacterium]|nr:tetratricopeptide repeat protein [Candidatus Omnitrophota bacterium]